VSRQLYFTCLSIAQILLLFGYLYALYNHCEEWMGLTALFVMFTAMLVGSRLAYDRYLRISSEQTSKSDPKVERNESNSGK